MSWNPVRPSVLAGLVLALAVGATPAAAAGPSPASDMIVRQPPTGAVPMIRDMAALGGTIAIAWEATGDPAASGGVATSDNGGTSWGQYLALPDEHEARGDVCSSPMDFTGVLTYTTPGNDHVVDLEIHPHGRQLVDPDVDFLHPDVACFAGSRVATVLVRKTAQGSRLIVWQYQPDATDGATGVDLGKVPASTRAVIAATSTAVHVAWVSGNALHYRRIAVGAAPGYTMTAKPAQTIDSGKGLGLPQLAVDGKRVVLAWQRKGNVVARVSTNKGVSFGTQRTLFTGQPTSGKVAFLDSVAVRGSQVVVSGTVVSEGITATGSVMRTTNDGGTWRKVAGSTRTGGFVYAALSGSGADSQLYLAWDQRFTSNDPQAITFTTVALP